MQIISSKVHVIFSNAALHWILNHQKLYNTFFELLNQNGQLLIQCGGYGNLKKAISIFDKVKDSEKFKDYFKEWKEEWYFPKPSDTKNLLNEIGYKNIKVYLSEASIGFVNKSSYSLYLKTVVLAPYLRYIPSDNDKEEYLESILNEIEHNHLKMIWNLDLLD